MTTIGIESPKLFNFKKINKQLKTLLIDRDHYDKKFCELYQKLKKKEAIDLKEYTNYMAKLNQVDSQLCEIENEHIFEKENNGFEFSAWVLLLSIEEKINRVDAFNMRTNNFPRIETIKRYFYSNDEITEEMNESLNTLIENLKL